LPACYICPNKINVQIIAHIQSRLSRLSVTYPAYKSFPFRIYNVPSVSKYVTSKLSVCHMLLTVIYEKALLLVDCMPHYEQVLSITQQWGFCMQSLSSIFFPNYPCPLTRKIVRNNWRVSAWLITLVCLVTWFLPGQPTLLSRTRGTQLRYPLSGNDIMLEPSFNSKLPSQHIYNDFSQLVRANPADLQQTNCGWMFGTREGCFLGHLNAFIM